LADLRRLRGDRGRGPEAGLRLPGRAGRADRRRRGADALQPAAGEDRHPLQRRHQPAGAGNGWQEGAGLMSDVNMPKLSDTMEEGTVIEWKKQTGDAVKKGDVLAEVESDKASFELEADADGVLSIVVDAGTPVPVGDLIANIGKEGEAPAQKAAPKAAPKAEAKPEPETARPEPAEPESAVEEPEEEPQRPAAQVETPSDGARIKASPIAARLAAEMGVNLAQLKGSGPEGRIVKEDVLAAAKQGSAGRRPSASPRGPARTGPDVEHEELTRIQTIVARRMV